MIAIQEELDWQCYAALKLTQEQMGFVTSPLGFGGFVGQFAVPGISDKLGRKPTAILAFLGAAITVWLFMGIGATPNSLFLMLFLVSFFSLGNVALITGPIATEAAPAGLISAAIGIVVAVGEVFGGGIAPVIGGAIAQSKGIENILWMPLVGVALGAIVSLFVKETAPAKMANLAAAAVSNRNPAPFLVGHIGFAQREVCVGKNAADCADYADV